MFFGENPAIFAVLRASFFPPIPLKLDWLGQAEFAKKLPSAGKSSRIAPEFPRNVLA
jgi:hypothetical protein